MVLPGLHTERERMAAPRSTDYDENAEEEPSRPTAPVPQVATVHSLKDKPQAPWTIPEAFGVLREALAHHFEHDNMPAYLSVQESQMVFDNSGGVIGHPNAVMAWRQLLPLLEQALGASLKVF